MNETKLRFSMQGAGWTETFTTRLEFVKTFGGRKHPKEMRLTFIKAGEKYRLVPPKYESRCCNSIFDFNAKEGIGIRMRTTFNRGVLTSIIKSLKQFGIWEFIDNQDFLVPNMFNKKTEKGKVRSDLKELLA